jgi:Zn-dependent M16 (insulinase) family peptidase
MKLINLSRYRRKLFPQGNGYRSETGGLLESLRKLDLSKIKKYHSRYYVPHNLCLVVTGRISTRTLLEKVQETIESRAHLHKQDTGPKPEGWKRPFVETESAVVPKIDTDSSIFVDFPAKEEKFGEVTMVMIGPHPDEELILSVGFNMTNFYCSDV